MCGTVIRTLWDPALATRAPEHSADVVFHSVCVAGDAETAKRVAASTRVSLPATSLGGVESPIEHRRSVEGPHDVVDPALLRLPIGIEDVDDLNADCGQALSESGQ